MVFIDVLSSSQQAYDDAFEPFDTLDELDDLLGNQRYLCGEMVPVDWRLLSTRLDLIWPSWSVQV